MDKKKFSLGDILRKINEDSQDSSANIPATIQHPDNRPEKKIDIQKIPSSESTQSINDDFPLQPILGSPRPDTQSV
ncbi:MAG: hypothetical protein GX640_03480, partial [Fibrobacter sp.]|nr:hypothetical protein [Fibrobacter sp.]